MKPCNSHPFPFLVLYYNPTNHLYVIANLNSTGSSVAARLYKSENLPFHFTSTSHCTFTFASQDVFSISFATTGISRGYRCLHRHFLTTLLTLLRTIDSRHCGEATSFAIIMVSERPTTPQSAKPVAEDSSNLAATQASEKSDVSALQNDLSKPDDTQQKESTMKTVFLLISVFGSMFLVALDRTIISTV